MVTCTWDKTLPEAAGNREDLNVQNRTIFIDIADCFTDHDMRNMLLHEMAHASSSTTPTRGFLIIARQTSKMGGRMSGVLIAGVGNPYPISVTYDNVSYYTSICPDQAGHQ